MNMISRYLERSEFTSYEDFHKHYKLQIPENFDFARDIVDGYAQQQPEKLALLYLDEHGFERRFTFAEISLLSKKAAAYFLSIGIKAGDRVLTLLRRRWEYWVCAVALHRIGAVPVPASVQLRTKDIAYRIDAVQACAILAIDSDFVLEQISGLHDCKSLKYICTVNETGKPNPYLNLDAGIAESQPYEGGCSLRNSDLFIIYFTSGSTGMPKPVIHDRVYPLGHIITAKYMQCVADDGLHLTYSDSGWAKFGWGNIYGQWICGSAIFGYDPERFIAEDFIKNIRPYPITSLCVPPTMYRFLLRAGLCYEDVKDCRHFSTAGEPLGKELADEFQKACGSEIREGFGQSETTPITCSFPWLPARYDSMGKPSPLYDVHIVDENGHDCPAGVQGEIVIRGAHKAMPAGLTRGYVSQGKIIRYENDTHHTGDIAFMDEDGFYHYVGRNDDMIKCSGYRIGPFEIETVLNTHPAIKESVIIGRYDSVRGLTVCAVVSLHDGYSESAALTKELQTFVKQMTAPYKYPRTIVYLPAIPKTSTGKTDRPLLKKLYSGK